MEWLKKVFGIPTNFWGYLRIHTFTFVVFFIVGVIFVLFLFPAQKNSQNELVKKYSELSKVYIEEQLPVADVKLSKSAQKKEVRIDSAQAVVTEVKAEKLQEQITDIQSGSKITTWIVLILTALFLATLAGVLANWIQYIYTTMEFTKVSGGTMVLAAALLGAFFIVGIVYFIMFNPNA